MAVSAAASLHFPESQFLIEAHPVVERRCQGYHRGYVGELRTVVNRSLFRHKALGVQVFLYRQEYLVGVDRLDEVVGDVVADSLVHDILLLTLGDHYDGSGRCRLLDALQRLQPGQSRHVLIENDEVEMLRLREFEGIAAVVDGHEVISFGFEEHYVGLEEVNLIIGPKYIELAHMSL